MAEREPMQWEVRVQKRYESKNIPIEILRSFVTVVDTGSYTRAGELLNLSQAAVSAQIARLRAGFYAASCSRAAPSGSSPAAAPSC